MEFRHIIYKPGKVAQIIFNRPEYLNAQEYLLLEETDQAFKLAEKDKKCGAVVLSGEFDPVHLTIKLPTGWVIGGVRRTEFVANVQFHRQNNPGARSVPTGPRQQVFHPGIE